MKSIIMLTMTLLFSSAAISQVLKIARNSITTSEDGISCVSSDISTIPQGAHIDLALLRVKLGDAQVSKTETYVLVDNEGKRVSMTAVGPTNTANRGEQVLKFLITHHIQSVRDNRAQEIHLLFKSTNKTTALDLSSRKADDVELVVYYTPGG